MTGAELVNRFCNKTLVWCDKNGTPVADQTTPTGYIRPLSKAEGKKASRIAYIDQVLAANPEFERCDADGTANPTGTHWRLREADT
jgi:hypothetical protein